MLSHPLVNIYLYTAIWIKNLYETPFYLSGLWGFCSHCLLSLGIWGFNFRTLWGVWRVSSNGSCLSLCLVVVLSIFFSLQRKMYSSCKQLAFSWLILKGKLWNCQEVFSHTGNLSCTDCSKTVSAVNHWCTALSPGPHLSKSQFLLDIMKFEASYLESN